MNPLSNALKFTPADGVVRVEVSEVGNEVEVAVIDSGPGILPEELPLLFEKFRQTSSAKSAPRQGTGLGLVIGPHLIEAHSGQIWAESQPGDGARFIFRLPRIGPTAWWPAPAGHRTILIVDDEPAVARCLGNLLVLDGHAVEIVPTAAVALEKLAARAYDVIVTDIRMPELDGLGLYREVERRQPALCARFVFVTGYAVSPGIRAFFERTALPCLSKPFALEEIRQLVQWFPEDSRPAASTGRVST